VLLKTVTALLKALQSQGYEFDEEYSGRKETAEIWINKKAGLGIRECGSKV